MHGRPARRDGLRGLHETVEEAAANDRAAEHVLSPAGREGKSRLPAA